MFSVCVRFIRTVIPPDIVYVSASKCGSTKIKAPIPYNQNKRTIIGNKCIEFEYLLSKYALFIPNNRVFRNDPCSVRYANFV